MLFNRLTFEQQKTIRDQRRAKRSPDGGSLDRPTWTAERKSRVGPNSDARKIRDLRNAFASACNGWKDPGNYAGKVCLITRHGWNPIVMPGGVERFLRDQGLWEKYENHWPTNSKQVPFQRGDRFYVEWERLEDGTRSFITMVAKSACTGPQKLDTKLREYTGVQAKGKAMSGRRKHAPEFKAKVVMEILTGEMTTMQASRRYGIKDSLLYRWKSEFWERLPQIYGQSKIWKADAKTRRLPNSSVKWGS